MLAILTQPPHRPPLYKYGSPTEKDFSIFRMILSGSSAPHRLKIDRHDFFFMML